ncbi:hypothetical protein J6590_023341 [Homalodisca vitripennis]|nr:hypothetical protein J6590_023341 [Homalodisca vitripennis]
MRSVWGQHSSYHNDVFLAPRKDQVVYNNQVQSIQQSPVLSSNDEDDNMDDVEYQTDSEVEDPDY